MQVRFFFSSIFLFCVHFTSHGQSLCDSVYVCLCFFDADWMNGNLKSEEVDRVEFDSCRALHFISITIRFGDWEVNWGKNAIL